MLEKSLGAVKGSLKKHAMNLLPEKVTTVMKKHHYARVLRSISESYDADFTVMKHLVNRGDHVLDLGAHVGTYTKYLSDLVGDSGRVYSVEPVPATFDILRSNVRKLSLTNVELINFAVSDVDESVVMEIPWEFGFENFWDARIARENSNPLLRHVTVESKTVDSLFSHLVDEISFIKCDVEGNEVESIRGATDLIKRFKPSWLIEVSLTKRPAFDELCGLLYKEGYQDYWFDGTALRRWREGDGPINLFFLSAKGVGAARTAALIQNNG